MATFSPSTDECQQTIYNLMGAVIENDLTFHSNVEKQAWKLESNKWRLPYWDWALPSNHGNVPTLFTLSSVKIRVPAAAHGLQPPPELVSNPLYRYQMLVNGLPTKMGDLPHPYTVDSVKLRDGTVLPVSVKS